MRKLRHGEAKSDSRQEVWLGFEARKSGAGSWSLITTPSCLLYKKRCLESCLPGLMWTGQTGHSYPRLCQGDTLPLSEAFRGSCVDPEPCKEITGKDRSWHRSCTLLEPHTCDLRVSSVIDSGAESGQVREEGPAGRGTSWRPQISSPVLLSCFPNPGPPIWPVSLLITCLTLGVYVGGQPD